VLAIRIARPTRHLDRAVEFYRDGLGLPVRGGFTGHEGYDGVFFVLPGGGELELTAGPVPPSGWSEEDLLVLYVADRTALDRQVAALRERGVRCIAAANPYWNRVGRTVLDPDGFRVVLAVRERATFRVERFEGERCSLRASFELAEDSALALDAYLRLGTVFVARIGDDVIGHLQLVPGEPADCVELKNMAVQPEYQGHGVGRALVDAAVRHAAEAGRSTMVVATATADTGNLRFYQRVGFRMTSVEPDAFTPATGYPEPIDIDGIELRDRVWFSRTIVPDTT